MQPLRELLDRIKWETEFGKGTFELGLGTATLGLSASANPELVTWCGTPSCAHTAAEESELKLLSV